MEDQQANSTETSLRLTTNDTTATVLPYILLAHLNPVAVVCFTVAYAIVIPTSLAGNIMNIYTIRRNPTLKTTTNFLILNLSSADLITTFLSCPYQITSLFIGKRWFQGHFADFLCKLLPYSKNVTVTSSITTLVLISLDRFYSVYYPTKRSPIASHKRKLVLVTWLLSIVIPIATYFQHKNTRFADGNHYCYYDSVLGGPVAVSTIAAYAVIKTFLFFSLPIAIMCTLYTFIYNKLWNRRAIGSNLQHVAVNKRVTMAMVAIVTNFILCWLPLEICAYLDFMYGYSSGSLSHARVFSYWMWNMNSATNPWLYAYFNKALRLQYTSLFTDITTFFSPRRARSNQVIAVESTPGEKTAGSMSVGAKNIGLTALR